MSRTVQPQLSAGALAQDFSHQQVRDHDGTPAKQRSEKNNRSTASTDTREGDQVRADF
jgi:hypothetical protein